METLLPSEIARLVLGYLEDQKCMEAGKIFLETSPHLQECRTVVSKGRRFSTRVGGMTLVDVIEKFVAITSAIQERLSKIADCEQLRHCGDALEQLKFLVEETRSQRFVVNINVPSQANAQISNGSPILSSNVRKRRHSNSDRERCKRLKITSNSFPQSEFPVSTATGSNSVEATPLESLPGHGETPCQSNDDACAKEEEHNMCQQKHRGGDQDDRIVETDAVDENTTTLKDEYARNFCQFEKCSAATSTEELLSYTSAEVQTNLYDTPESESETNDEPIENLSLLTKELLNRTELQERIAENINKAILPADTSAKDDALNDSTNIEANSSIMIELTNAIKSIVEATEADPIFEKFLDEIIGPHVETDTSPDEDMEIKPKVKVPSDSREKQPETNTVVEHGASSVDEKSSNETEGIVEVPLKHRLRSSSRQQNVRIEDEQRDQEKEYNALEDQNAAAIMSIINANITGSIPSSDKRISDSVKDVVHLENESEKKLPVFERSPNKDKPPPADVRSTSVNNEKDCDNSKGNTGIVQCNDAESKMKKSTVKRPRVGKPKNETVLNNVTNGHQLEQDIMTMPMLIVCSKQETNDILAANAGVSSVPASRFIPIMPNGPTVKNGKDFVETLYLKTVNVAQKVPAAIAPLPNTLNEPKNLIVCANGTLQARPKGFIKMNSTPRSAAVSSIVSIDVPSTASDNADIAVTNKYPREESITLYGNEHSARTSLDRTNLPTINVEDSISLSGTELSPYIKFSCNKSQQNQSLSDIDLTPVDQNVQIVEAATHKIVAPDDQQQPSASTSASPSKTAEHNMIDKRTPRSLLRRRSKNHRLSLSTPRRRSSHVRALDFNTPSKMVIPSNKLIGQNQNQDENENNARPSSRSGATKHLKPVRRTSLFRSPPFPTHVTRTTHRLKSPLKHCRSSAKPPTAARSPESKLSGGWDKCNGMAVIIESKEDTSKESAPAIACSGTVAKPQPETSKPREKDSWDADLRKALQITTNEESQKTRKSSKIPRLPKTKTIEATKKKPVTRKDGRKKKDALPIVNETSESNKITVVSLMENGNDTGGKVVAKSEIVALKLVGGSDGNCNREQNRNDNNSDKPVQKRAQEPAKTAVATTVEPKIVKKCNADKRKQNSSNRSIATTSSDGLQQCSELAKIPVDIGQQMLQQQIPDLIALETPRKCQTYDVPPTPRLLSPSSNSTPFLKVNEDTSKIGCFISTPEFPTTPSIVLTPKNSNEDTVADNAKKEAFQNCSPYYKPTSEQDECSEKPLRILKLSKTVEKSSTLVSQVSMQAVSSPRDINKSTNTFQSCVSAKLEITQFEGVKENPPEKEEAAAKDVKTSRADSPTRYAKFKSDCAKDNAADVVSHDNNDNENDANSVTSCSSCSSSSSSSSSSSFSSSSSSSSASSPSTFLLALSNQPKDTSSPDKSSVSKKCNKPSQNLQPDGSETLTSRNDISKLKIKITRAPSHTKEATAALSKNESSPTKVFSIFKSEQDLQTSTKETPAKDELLLNEADISETPSSSKAGVEHLTNLTSKISEFISSEDQEQPASKTNQNVTAGTISTCKNESIVSGGPTGSKDPSTASPEFKCKNNPEEPDPDMLFSNSVEYHFLHDDNAPVKKRRPRYSSQELEVQINMNNQGVKMMTATQYEEIFNLLPKWRKRSGNRKSPVKTETCSIQIQELFDKSPITLKTLAITHGKPLATSSPLDKAPTPKTKKLSIKTVHATNERNHEKLPDQPNNRKKTKLDKSDDSTAKILRRKLPESRENKPIDKRQYTTDPQTLLSNVDLEKFLTSVHGPA